MIQRSLENTTSADGGLDARGNLRSFRDGRLLLLAWVVRRVNERQTPSGLPGARGIVSKPVSLSFSH